jgi:hypothetical protein
MIRLKIIINCNIMSKILMETEDVRDLTVDRIIILK